MSEEEEKEVESKGPSKNEGIKAASRHLRGTLKEDLKNGTSGFSADNEQLLKFHGLYQQYNREKISAPKDRFHTFMIRGRIPGGRLSTKQYIVWDELGTRCGGGTFRLTTRQSIQLHGVVKGNIKKVMRDLRDVQLSSIAACGDVVRNVTQAVNPWGRPDLNQLDEPAQLISDHFKFKTKAYTEVWLDDEEVRPADETANPDFVDPIYGKLYLPRKFKIGVTLAGNNSIDIYTNDMSFAATLGVNGKIDGYFVFAGGGLGMTHGKAETFPRKADLVGWIPAAKLIPVAEAIVTIHRDFGDRSNRKHARLKYVIHDRGIHWFRIEVQNRSKTELIHKILPDWKTPSYLGWQERFDGSLALGFHTLSGRVKDFEGKPLKSGIREIVETYKLSVQVTADQDLVLIGIQKSDKEKIEKRLAELNLSPKAPRPIFERALACPALPTCSLAITESERFLPNFLGTVDKLLVKNGLSDRAPVIRMTGCPNGCARPYTAELGLVGQQAGGRYALYVGGDAEGTRIATRLADKVKTEELPVVLEKLFAYWRDEGKYNESFGDFTSRVPLEKLIALMPVAPAPAKAAAV